MLKNFLLAFLLFSAALFAADARLQSYPDAVQWEQEALDGDADAMYNLGHTYQTKVKDYNKAIYWYEKAYKQDGASDAANNIGYLYKEQKKYDEAIQWYQKAIDKNHALSCYNLAYLYDEILKKPEQAIPYYEKAYQFGNKSAPLSLGIIYKNNYQDYDKAIEWYKKAHNMGHTGGTNGLGYLYEHNLNDDNNAELWYKKAAAGNDTKALGNLAKFYKKKGDLVQAGAYALALIDNGFTKEKIFGYLKQWNLTQDQIKQAYELQKTLDIPKHYTGGID
jgi:TPR repeat protein